MAKTNVHVSNMCTYMTVTNTVANSTVCLQFDGNSCAVSCLIWFDLDILRLIISLLNLAFHATTKVPKLDFYLLTLPSGISTSCWKNTMLFQSFYKTISLLSWNLICDEKKVLWVLLWYFSPEKLSSNKWNICCWGRIQRIDHFE